VAAEANGVPTRPPGVRSFTRHGHDHHGVVTAAGSSAHIIVLARCFSSWGCEVFTAKIAYFENRGYIY